MTLRGTKSALLGLLREAANACGRAELVSVRGKSGNIREPSLRCGRDPVRSVRVAG